MKQTTLLSLPLSHWSISFGIHLVFFSAILLIGRGRMLDLTFIELDTASNSNISMAPNPISPNDDWQKPLIPKIRIPSPPPKPEVKAPEESAVTGPPVSGGVDGAGKVHSIAQVSQLPHYLNQVKAQYPAAAKRANIEGVVILQVDIDAAGRVKKVDLIQGLGYGCDEAAIAAIQQCTFTPALAGGEPVPVSMRLPYRFKFDY